MSTIDPNTVKAGDTVTLERGEPHPAKIEGVVQEVKEYPTPKTQKARRKAREEQEKREKAERKARHANK